MTRAGRTLSACHVKTYGTWPGICLGLNQPDSLFWDVPLSSGSGEDGNRCEITLSIRADDPSRQGSAVDIVYAPPMNESNDNMACPILLSAQPSCDVSLEVSLDASGSASMSTSRENLCHWGSTAFASLFLLLSFFFLLYRRLRHEGTFGSNAMYMMTNAYRKTACARMLCVNVHK